MDSAQARVVVGKSGLRPPSLPAQLVEAAVGRHPVGPRRERGPPVERIEASDDGDERLLTAVFGIMGIGGEPAAQCVQAGLMTTEEYLQVTARSPARRGYKIGVGEVLRP
jgi:hypothetical protein